METVIGYENIPVFWATELKYHTGGKNGNSTVSSYRIYVSSSGTEGRVGGVGILQCFHRIRSLKRFNIQIYMPKSFCGKVARFRTKGIAMAEACISAIAPPPESGLRLKSFLLFFNSNGAGRANLNAGFAAQTLIGIDGGGFIPLKLIDAYRTNVHAFAVAITFVLVNSNFVGGPVFGGSVTLESERRNGQ
jgi:hypothetical protein